MTIEVSSLLSLEADLHRFGYVFISRWRCEQSTIDIAQSLGIVVDIHTCLPGSAIPTVQTLIPRHESESPGNQYSGTFGLAEFPLHTDLAHWAIPPRYFILRCRKGSPSVPTYLLHNSALTATLGNATLRRALVRPRHPSRSGVNCLLPLVLSADDHLSLRWDSLFLVPMNEAARRAAEAMKTNAWDESKLAAVTLTSPGDTLIVDNWRMLHGRGGVREDDMDRRVERVYLSEIHI